MKRFELPEPVDDGLFIPDVRPWSRDKHHFLRRYLHAFTEAMKAKKWDSLHYIDLFAGAGIERLVDGERVIGLDWGSPLIAAQMPTKFNGFHFVEKESERHSALSRRLERFSLGCQTQVLLGDANTKVGEVVKQLPAGSLSTAFLDPYGLHLHYGTLKLLASRRVDLIIYFPDRVDALRNWGVLYEEDTNSELDLVLGGAPWRNEKNKAPPDRWCDLLSQIYVEQIRKLGYSEFEHERIRTTGGQPLYKLIFCSKDKAGGTIWRRVSRKKPSGQDSFDFG